MERDDLNGGDAQLSTTIKELQNWEIAFFTQNKHIPEPKHV